MTADSAQGPETSPEVPLPSEPPTSDPRAFIPVGVLPPRSWQPADGPPFPPREELLAPYRVVEEGRRFADCALWPAMASYYQDMGHRAWSNAGVPSFVTTNAWIARAYARVISSLLTSGPGPGGEPPRVTVLELGAGPGRLAWLILGHLQRWLNVAPGQLPPVRYLMTDGATTNVLGWRARPELERLYRDGWLDMGVFNLSHPQPFTSRSGLELSTALAEGPVVVVSNYVFDSLPQEAFFIGAGGPVGVKATVLEEEGADPTEAPWRRLPHTRVLLEADEAWEPTTGRADLDSLLATYSRELPRSMILMPTRAVEVMEFLWERCPRGCVLLSADKGHIQPEEVARAGVPSLALHHSFSAMVNYHAIGRWWEGRGGVWLSPLVASPSICVVAGVCGIDLPGSLPLRMALDDLVGGAGPEQLFALLGPMESLYGRLSLDQMLAWLRLVWSDPQVLSRAVPTLLPLVVNASVSERRALRKLAVEASTLRLPGEGGENLPFHLGALFFEMGHYREALASFEQSAVERGRPSAVLYNLAMCHVRLQEYPRAQVYLREALVVDPSNDAARSLLLELSE